MKYSNIQQWVVMKRFFELSRAPFFTAVIIPMLWGTMLARRQTEDISWLRFLLTLLGLLAAHASANLLNDYYDFKLGADTDNPWRNPFSGGSPHLAENRERPATFLALGIISLSIAALCAIILAWVVDRGFGPVIIFAAIGAFGGIFYTTPPLKFAYRGCGEICIFVCFGVLTVVGAFYVQTGALTWLTFGASLPVALLVTNIIWINEFPDCQPDMRAGKRHLVGRLGLAKARWGYHIMAGTAFLLIMILDRHNLLGPRVWYGLAGLLPALCASVILHRHYAEPIALLPAQALTITAHIVTGVGLCLGIAV